MIAGDYRIEQWALPAMRGSAQPDLMTTPDGRLLLSWINHESGRRPALQFAELYPDQHWEGPRTIVVGNSLMINSADTPHITATADRALWVHRQQTSPDAPNAERIMLARSLDHGMNWSAPRQIHDDVTQTEHGFVSLWPQSESSLGIAWLDGRNTAPVDQPAHHDHGIAKADHDTTYIDVGAMSLRSVMFDANLQASAGVELDAMVCDCCQTAAAATSDGALLVYRDRSVDDIRDIYAIRFDGKAWSKPQRVHADNWKMTACPVNGPSLAAQGNLAVAAWYTAANGTPSVKLARSVDAGAHFSNAVTVDENKAVLGRIAVAMDGAQTWVLWLREDAGVQSLWLARYAPDLAHELQRVKIATLQGKGSATGFPKLALRNGAAYAVWTEVIDGEPQLRGVVMAGVAAHQPAVR